jgi:tyrosine-specific transport protein
MVNKRGNHKELQGFFGRNKTLVAATTLIGTIVGAGILGIPYVVAKAGFLYGFILIVVMGLAFLFLNLFCGEVVLRTKSQHQLTGYAEKYLGPWGKRLMTLSMFVAIYGALTAYLIGEGAALYSIFNFGTPLIYTFIFFVLVSFIIFKGVKATGKMELILITLLLVIVVLIGIFSFKEISLDNFSSTLNPAFFILPYGVILFAFMASPAIPELQEVLGKSKKKMKKAIIIGSVVPIFLYLIFTVIIMGVVGLQDFELLSANERIATVALSIYANPLLGLFANILAVLAMFTSFLTLGIALVEVYAYDYNVNRKLAYILTLAIPLIIVLFNFTTFLAVLGVTGAIAGGLDGILVMLMYWRAKKLGNRKPEYSLGKHWLIGGILILMFAVGIIYQIWHNMF